MRYLPVLLVTCAALLFGLGCQKKPSSAPTNTQGAGYVPQAYLPPTAPQESDNAKNLRELRDAIAAFKNVKTFRAKVSVATQNGQMAGQVDVMKPDRFHGTFQVPNAKGGTDASDVVGVASTFYLHLPDGSWTYVTNEEKSKALTAAFRSALDGEDSVLTSLIPDSATVSKSTDASLGCDRYTTTLTDEKGETSDVHICVAKGLPKRIEITPKTGGATIDYFDYNALFVIERPLGVHAQ